MAVEPDQVTDPMIPSPDQTEIDPRVSFFRLVEVAIVGKFPNLRKITLEDPVDHMEFEIDPKGFESDRHMKTVWMNTPDGGETEGYFVPGDTIDISLASHSPRGKEPVRGAQAVREAEERLRRLLGLPTMNEALATSNAARPFHHEYDRATYDGS